MKVISQSVLDPMQCLKVPPQSWLHSCLSLDVAERRQDGDDGDDGKKMAITMTPMTMMIIIKMTPLL